MTPWEFNACIEGWQNANSPADENADLPELTFDQFHKFMKQ